MKRLKKTSTVGERIKERLEGCHEFDPHLHNIAPPKDKVERRRKNSIFMKDNIHGDK